ncbi:hypothetical protein CLV24_1055 [Pontibacter ummariensis]|uniref:Uncharacterized protein n=1 Tax=Pontibacter ummariensis TaxID=1610492 RepID=A0A239E3Z9_9BACT|nr:hypothetical protein CLV24_1055 [Pontibacter ummariensis]SNS38713.1 hypothetical protein SAMN06296052_105246 [Pontibacter ummariensis]
MKGKRYKHSTTILGQVKQAQLDEFCAYCF